MSCEGTSLQSSLLLHNVCHGVHEQQLSYLDVNTAILLLYELKMHTHLFALLIVPVIFLLMSPVSHEFNLDLPQHKSFAWSLLVSK